MPSASAKLEKQASVEATDPLGKVLTILEKKVRNLEKRKGKLDTYKQEAKDGKQLNEDQLTAVGKYDEVMGTLEFAKELQKNIVSLSQDSIKQAKKLAKRDQVERQSQEMQKMRELLIVQDVLNNMGLEHVRSSFLTGTHGALLLTEDNLNQLDELYKLISPSRDLEEGTPSYDEQLGQASDHLVALLESKNKEVLGTNYKDLRELIFKIHDCGFLSGSYALQKGEVNGEEEEVEQPPAEADKGYSEPQEEEYNEESPAQEVEPAKVESNVEEAPTQQTPLNLSNAPQMDTYYPGPYPSNRPLSEVISSVQGNFNFLQESQIDLESPHMDPAVVAAHPMTPAASLTYSQQTSAIPSYQNQQQTSGTSETSQGKSQNIQATQNQQSMTQLQQPMSQQIPLGQPEFNQPIPSQTFTNQTYVAMQSMPSNPQQFTNQALYNQIEQTLPQMGHPGSMAQQGAANAVDKHCAPAQSHPEGPNVGLVAQIPQQQGGEPKKHSMNVNAAAFESVSYKQPNMGGDQSSPPIHPSLSQPMIPTNQTGHFTVPQTRSTTRHSPSPDTNEAGGWSTATKSQSPGSYPHQQSANFQSNRGNFNNSRGGRGGRGSRGSTNGFNQRGGRGGNGNGGTGYSRGGGSGSYQGNYFPNNYPREGGYGGNGGQNNFANNYKRGAGGSGGRGGRGDMARGIGGPRGGGSNMRPAGGNPRSGNGERGGYAKAV